LLIYIKGKFMVLFAACKTGFFNFSIGRYI
jgi:hypothetical protein